jgi:ABC-2 type transport system permease protein
MKNIYWLVRRELWEHKGSMIYTPLGIAAVVFVVAIGAATAAYFKIDHSRFPKAREQLNAMIASGESRQMADGLIYSISTPLLAIGFLIVTFYLLGSLFEDRKDKSIFFWKSLPISDQETVLSKAVVALIISPTIILLTATVLYFLFAIIICIAGSLVGFDTIGVMFTGSNFLTAPFKLIALIPIQLLWALPSAGWLLLVSAAARTKPLLWAAGIPLIAGLIIVVARQLGILESETSRWIIDDVIVRSFSGLLPGGWQSSNLIIDRPIPGFQAVGSLVEQSYAMLLTAKIWIGAALGAAMIFAAIELRGSNTEI